MDGWYSPPFSYNDMGPIWEPYALHGVFQLQTFMMILIILGLVEKLTAEQNIYATRAVRSDFLLTVFAKRRRLFFETCSLKIILDRHALNGNPKSTIFLNSQ